MISVLQSQEQGSNSGQVPIWSTFIISKQVALMWLSAETYSLVGNSTLIIYLKKAKKAAIKRGLILAFLAS